VLDALQAEAIEFAERAKRWVFGDYTVECDGGPRREVDTALGVAQWQPPDTLPSLLARANKSIYAQKNSR
jgi:hypothetical protein